MWWRRRRTDEDFGQEIHSHLAIETDRLISEGMSPKAASAAAARRFGNTAGLKEWFYESRRVLWLDQ